MIIISIDPYTHCYRDNSCEHGCRLLASLMYLCVMSNTSDTTYVILYSLMHFGIFKNTQPSLNLSNPASRQNTTKPSQSVSQTVSKSVGQCVYDLIPCPPIGMSLSSPLSAGTQMAWGDSDQGKGLSVWLTAAQCQRLIIKQQPQQQQQQQPCSLQTAAWSWPHSQYTHQSVTTPCL